MLFHNNRALLLRRIVSTVALPIKSNQQVLSSIIMDQDRIFRSLRKFIWDDAECQALSSFVTRETINVDSNSASSERCGILLQSVMGGGKTSVLKLLHSSLKKKNVLYMDCSILSLANRYALCVVPPCVDN